MGGRMLMLVSREEPGGRQGARRGALRRGAGAWGSWCQVWGLQAGKTPQGDFEERFGKLGAIAGRDGSKHGKLKCESPEPPSAPPHTVEISPK